MMTNVLNILIGLNHGGDRLDVGRSTIHHAIALLIGNIFHGVIFAIRVDESARVFQCHSSGPSILCKRIETCMNLRVGSGDCSSRLSNLNLVLFVQVDIEYHIGRECCAESHHEEESHLEDTTIT